MVTQVQYYQDIDKSSINNKAAFRELLRAKNDFRCLFENKDIDKVTNPSNTIMVAIKLDSSPDECTKVGIKQEK